MNCSSTLCTDVFSSSLSNHHFFTKTLKSEAKLRGNSVLSVNYACRHSALGPGFTRINICLCQKTPLWFTSFVSSNPFGKIKQNTFFTHLDSTNTKYLDIYFIQFNSIYVSTIYYFSMPYLHSQTNFMLPHTKRKDLVVLLFLPTTLLFVK